MTDACDTFDTFYTFDKNKHSMNDILYKSFQLLMNDNTDNNSFYSKYITTLNDFINQRCFSIMQARNLFYCMYRQITYLVENNIGISFLDLQDIKVINNEIFFFCNPNKLHYIKNKKITVTEVYDKKHPFLPIEFIQNDTLPFTTYYTSSYYSLAKLILYCLAVDNRSNSNIDYVLHDYRDSKLYTILDLCIQETPTDRHLIFF